MAPEENKGSGVTPGVGKEEHGASQTLVMASGALPEQL